MLVVTRYGLMVAALAALLAVPVNLYEAAPVTGDEAGSGGPEDTTDPKDPDQVSGHLEAVLLGDALAQEVIDSQDEHVSDTAAGLLQWRLLATSEPASPGLGAFLEIHAEDANGEHLFTWGNPATGLVSTYLVDMPGGEVFWTIQAETSGATPYQEIDYTVSWAPYDDEDRKDDAQ